VSKQIPKQSKSTRSGKISESATNQLSQAVSTDDQNPSFRFTAVDDNRWLLSDWNSAEINDLISALKKFEKYTWAQIKSQGSKTRGESVGCGFKIIQSSPKLPENVSEDVTLSEMRVDLKKRIFGFRVDSTYFIIWFDRKHDVCS